MKEVEEIEKLIRYLDPSYYPSGEFYYGSRSILEEDHKLILRALKFYKEYGPVDVR